MSAIGVTPFKRHALHAWVPDSRHVSLSRCDGVYLLTTYLLNRTTEFFVIRLASPGAKTEPESRHSIGSSVACLQRPVEPPSWRLTWRPPRCGARLDPHPGPRLGSAVRLRLGASMSSLSHAVAHPMCARPLAHPACWRATSTPAATLCCRLRPTRTPLSAFAYPNLVLRQPTLSQ